MTGTFTLSKQFRFEASHQLPHHAGKCRRLHGHSWVGWVTIQGTELFKDGSQTGMLTDYANLAEPLKQLVENYLDHHHLNETTGLENPTSEELARWIFNKLKGAWPGPRVRLVSVRIQETCTTECLFQE